MCNEVYNFFLLVFHVCFLFSSNIVYLNSFFFTVCCIIFLILDLRRSCLNLILKRCGSILVFKLEILFRLVSGLAFFESGWNFRVLMLKIYGLSCLQLYFCNFCVLIYVHLCL